MVALHATAGGGSTWNVKSTQIVFSEHGESGQPLQSATTGITVWQLTWLTMGSRSCFE